MHRRPTSAAHAPVYQSELIVIINDNVVRLEIHVSHLVHLVQYIDCLYQPPEVYSCYFSRQRYTLLSFLSDEIEQATILVVRNLNITILSQQFIFDHNWCCSLAEGYTIFSFYIPITGKQAIIHLFLLVKFSTVLKELKNTELAGRDLFVEAGY